MKPWLRVLAFGSAVGIALLGDTVDVASGKKVVISNILPRRDVSGEIMDCHDGNIEYEGGVFLLYCMAYGPCHNTACATAQCGGRLDHNISLYTSPDLASGSWK